MHVTFHNYNTLGNKIKNVAGYCILETGEYDVMCNLNDASQLFSVIIYVYVCINFLKTADTYVAMYSYCA